MHPQVTNKLARTHDVYRFGFESAGALEFVNEYSGLAECTGCYIDFAELKACMSLEEESNTSRGA